jgi:hypothetical protein
MKQNLLFFMFIALAKSEGYYCPYESLGYDGTNDLLYDYYDSRGDYWIRIGNTGWETRESYCKAKGDITKHFDAGQGKCEDSQGTCIWDGISCDVNVNKQPDCFELCRKVANNEGLSCLGNCPNGYSSREKLYQVCSETPTPTPTNRTTINNSTTTNRTTNRTTNIESTIKSTSDKMNKKHNYYKKRKCMN